jgi:hypothetical protein
MLNIFLTFQVNNKFENPKFWSIIDLLIQQVVLQFSDGKNLDCEFLSINFGKLMEKFLFKFLRNEKRFDWFYICIFFLIEHLGISKNSK